MENKVGRAYAVEGPVLESRTVDDMARVYDRGRARVPQDQPTLRSTEISLPRTAPSLNRLLRLHWADRRKLKDDWQWLLLAERAKGNFPKHQTKLKITITRFSPKLLDTDNLYGSCKIVLDAMKAVGILVDDSPSHIDLICSQAKGKSRTQIKVEIA